jgi:AcrR family transcriptional regulator
MGTVAVEKWTPERRRQLTRDTLIDAAATVFARRGFHGASLEEIAETAGFTRGAIYKNFTDKEELFLAVWERFNQRALSEFAELLGSGSPELEGVSISAIAEKWRKTQTADPDFFAIGLEFKLYLLRNPDARDRVTARQHEGAHRVAEFMQQRAAAAGAKLPMPAEDLANIFLITSDGFTMASLTEPELARLYEPFLELMIRGMVVLEDEVTNAPSSRTRQPG